MVAFPSLGPLEAWLLPWDYALDLCDTLARRSRRLAGQAATAAQPPVRRRKMSDGKGEHSSGVSQLMALFGA